MIDMQEARYAWECICGETNRDVSSCDNCGLQMRDPVRTETWQLWEKIIRAEECKRIARALESDVQVNGIGKMMMDHIIAIVRGTYDD